MAYPLFMPRTNRRVLSRRSFLASASSLAALAAAGCAASPARDGAETPLAQAAEPTGTIDLHAPGVASDGPLPTNTPAPTATQLPSPTVEEMAGAILLLGFRGTTLAASNPIVADIRDRHLGGVLLFSYDVPSARPLRNIQSPQQLTALTAALQSQAGSRKLLIATDQEGGQVARLTPAFGFPATQSHAALGATGSAATVRSAAASMGETLATAGINWDLAPVADVNVNPSNPIIGALDRSFSADPATVATMAAAFVDGLHNRRILASLKHFPGHGSSLSDSHAGFVDISDTWSDAELVPFRSLIDAGKADSVLAAHVFNRHLDPDLPASLSHSVIQGLLRDTLGYDGVVITDDMQMGAITQEYGFEDALRLTLLAGADVVTLGNNLEAFDPELGTRAHSTIVGLVNSGAVPRARLEQAYHRVEALRARAL